MAVIMWWDLVQKTLTHHVFVALHFSVVESLTVSPPDRDFSELLPENSIPPRRWESGRVCYLSMPIMWCNKSKRAKKLSLSLSKMQVGSWSESQHMITASATDCRQLTDACLDYQVETKGNMLKKHTHKYQCSVLSCFFWFLLCSVWTNKGGIKVSLHWGDSVEFLYENGYYLQTRKSGGKQCCHTSDFFAISSDFSDSSNDSISKKQLVMNLVTSSGVMGDFARLWHE